MDARRGALAALAAAVGVAVLLLLVLRGNPAAEEPAEEAPPPPRKAPAVQPNPRPVAMARIAGTGGSVAQGTVRLIARDENGVAIDYRLENLPPGKHALAVRQTGDCSAVSEAEPLGELGEVAANVRGRARGRLGHDRMSLGEGPVDVLGRVLVIHEGDPAGRIVGCGLIESL